MSGERTGVDALDTLGLFMADRAFLDTQAEGATMSRCVRAALAAYVENAAGRQAGAQHVSGPSQYLVTVPEDHPELAGGQVLVRSFDDWNTIEISTRPDHHATWSRPIEGERA